MLRDPTFKRTSSSPILIVQYVLVASVLIACHGGTDGTDYALGVAGDTQAPVTFEEFEANAIRDHRGGYIVDGDIYLPDVDALRTYYESWYDSSTSLTVNQAFNADDLWLFPSKYDLTFCVSDSFAGQKAALVTALQSAAESWHSIVGVRFVYVPGQDATCTSSNTNVVFDVNPAPSGATYNASAFFPSNARSSRNVLVAPSAFTTSFGGRDLEGILRHELGHTLGFRHEHIWLMPTCSSEGTSSARAVNSYDVDSVMHYPECRPSGTGGYRQTAADYEGAVSLYGLSPQLVMATL